MYKRQHTHTHTHTHTYTYTHTHSNTYTHPRVVEHTKIYLFLNKRGSLPEFERERQVAINNRSGNTHSDNFRLMLYAIANPPAHLSKEEGKEESEKKKNKKKTASNMPVMK